MVNCFLLLLSGLNLFEVREMLKSVKNKITTKEKREV